MRTRNKVVSSVVSVGAITAAVVATTTPSASASSIQQRASAILGLAVQSVGVELPICYIDSNNVEKCVSHKTTATEIQRVELGVVYSASRQSAPPDVKSFAGYPLTDLPTSSRCYNKTGILLGIIGGHTTSALYLEVNGNQVNNSGGKTEVPHPLTTNQTVVFTCLPV